VHSKGTRRKRPRRELMNMRSLFPIRIGSGTRSLRHIRRVRDALLRRDSGLTQVRGVTVCELLWPTKDNSGIAHLPDLSEHRRSWDSASHTARPPRLLLRRCGANLRAAPMNCRRVLALVLLIRTHAGGRRARTSRVIFEHQKFMQRVPSWPGPRHGARRIYAKRREHGRSGPWLRRRKCPESSLFP
jgi:hypothetical protein